MTGSFASSKRTIPSSPRLAKKDLALKPSRFGSPFAYWSYQNKPDFFKGLLVESTCVLFDQVVAEASNLKERLSTGVPLTNDGSNGHFCVLRKCESPSMGSDCSNESNSNDSKLDLYNFGPRSNSVVLPLSIDPTIAASHRTYAARNGLVDSIDSGDSSSTTSEISEADKLIDVRRVQNFKTGEIEYFVVNEGLDLFSINGIHVDFLVRAGPLPDFAVFELEHFSIFWWRTVTALDYMPVRGSMMYLLTAQSNADDFRRLLNANVILRTTRKIRPEKPSRAIPVSPTTYEACVWLTWDPQAHDS